MGARRVLTLAALLPVLAGCGFTPLYAEHGVVSSMAKIDIQTPQTRTGYLLREDLEDALVSSKKGPPEYRLAVQIVERRLPRGLRADDTADRYELELKVSYTLTRLETGEIVLQNTMPVSVTTDATAQPYASISDQLDSQARAAQETAQYMKLDVAKALSPK